MANLIVRNVDFNIVKALKARAGIHGISAEAEHRLILKEALISLQKKNFAEVLTEIPNVGCDSDFIRAEDNKVSDVFD